MSRGNVQPLNVSLNVDLGELPDEPIELYRLATLANVACGGHAGDEASMRRACALALASGCRLAAHPSYPDRAGFGRTSMNLDELDDEALRTSLLAQCRALQAIATELGASVVALKPHGALYHDVRTDEARARVLVEVSRTVFGDIAFVGEDRGALYQLASSHYLVEGFADRAYDGDVLRPRGRPGAVLEDPKEAAKQARTLLRRSRYQTLCVHGDTPNAVEIARAVREVMREEGALQ